MAKKKQRVRTRTITKIKRVYRTMAKRTKSHRGGRRSSGRSNGMNKAIDGIIAGAGAALLTKFVNLGGFNQPVADGLTGYFRHNETLTTLSGRSIGAMLAAGMNTGTSAGINTSYSIVG